MDVPMRNKELTIQGCLNQATFYMREGRRSYFDFVANNQTQLKQIERAREELQRASEYLAIAKRLLGNLQREEFSRE